jgi:hypothetical protein
MRKYQLINRIDNIEKYCSVLYVYDNPILYMNKNRECAMVYTEKELKRAKEHFENCGIYVMEKEVLISHKKTFDFKNDARL